MAHWRCPHCSTPQAEAARCWVCHRSTTSCGTCRHFHRSVANGLGLCGLDPRRGALTGAEMRACWAAPDPAPDDSPEARRPVPTGVVRGSADEIAGRRARTFVPVDELAAASRTVPEAVRRAGADERSRPPVPTVAPRSSAMRVAWSLWDDLDR